MCGGARQRLASSTVLLPITPLQGINPRDGLPHLRADWVARREGRGDTVFTQASTAAAGMVTGMHACRCQIRHNPCAARPPPLQMHYAKRGVVTEEMAFAAAREGLDSEFVRAEVRRRLYV